MFGVREEVRKIDRGQEKGDVHVSSRLVFPCYTLPLFFLTALISLLPANQTLETGEVYFSVLMVSKTEIHVANDLILVKFNMIIPPNLSYMYISHNIMHFQKSRDVLKYNNYF